MNKFVRASYKTVCHFADMNQATIFQAHIHKTAKIHNIEYRAADFLAHLKRFHGQHAMAQ